MAAPDSHTINSGASGRSSETQIYGPTYIAAGRDINRIEFRSGQSPQLGFQKLYEKSSTGAFHDSANWENPPKCHPKTRLAIIRHIKAWINSRPTGDRRITWISGSVAAGKSTLMHTIAAHCESSKILFASFFFSDALSQGNTAALIATLAYQLCVRSQALKDAILNIIERNPAILSANYEAQLKGLIIEPILDVQKSSKDKNPLPVIFILDALDECNRSQLKQILHMLFSKPLSANRELSIAFLVASRPELEIRAKFDQHINTIQMIKLDNSPENDQDINVFFKDVCNAIRDCHPMKAYIPGIWPTSNQLDAVITTASGHFSYPTAAAQYIGDLGGHPVNRLNTFLQNPESIPMSEVTSLKELDVKFIGTLSAVRQHSEEMVMDILALLVFHNRSGSDDEIERTLSVQFVGKLMECGPEEVRVALSDVHSLIDVPVTDASGILKLHHSTPLRNFLLDKSRSGHFFIVQKSAHMKLARRWFNLLLNLASRKGICMSQMTPEISFITSHFLYHGEHPSITAADEVSFVLVSFNLPSSVMEMAPGSCSLAPWIGLLSVMGQRKIYANFKQKLKGRISEIVLTALQLYPEPLRKSLPAALCIADGSHPNPSLIADIFSMLLHSMDLPPYVFRTTRHLDKTLFQFQDLSTTGLLDYNSDMTFVVELFKDPSRAGVYYVDNDKYRQLAHTLIKFLSQLTLAIEKIENESERQLSRKRDQVTAIQLIHPDLEYISEILEKSSRDAGFVKFLYFTILRGTKHKSLPQTARVNIEKFCSEYIKTCGYSMDEVINGVSSDVTMLQSTPNGWMRRTAERMTWLTSYLLQSRRRD